MALTSGTRLGVYEITAAIGEGGMGEVYRARDTKLGRDVALKILPDTFVSDPERVARFEREARTLAALNHPNIAIVHGFEESTGVQALVMELVEGPTLADRIAEGRIPLEEALPIARQIAEALEAAHEQGIIHRDLKPANIKLRPDGTVKVLDFGLAKALGTEGNASVASPLTQSPTITSPALLTGAGIILGTAAYMSPEQAKGKPADRRGDVWAFGCVFYEMLTGKRAFEGEDVSDTLASVLRGEPAWTGLPRETPDAVRQLLRRSLAKDRRNRLSDMTAARLDIDEALNAPFPAADPNATVSVIPAPPAWRRALPLVLTAIVVGSLAGVSAWLLKPAPRPTVSRSRYILQDQQRFTANPRQTIAISPDGTRMVYTGENRLYLRQLSELEARPIRGSEHLRGNLSHPVFSPDGQSIAFFTFVVGGTTGTLYRISANGGTPVTICQVRSTNFGMSWSPTGIIYGEGRTGIMRVSPNGGLPENIITVHEGEEASFPHMLPDNETVLFTVSTGGGADRWDSARIVAQRLRSAERNTLIEAGSDPRYVRTGHVVYALGGTLFAVPFDANKLILRGGPVPVVEGVRRSALGTAHYSVSETGSLIYVPGPVGSISALRRELVLIDRQGNLEALKVAPGPYEAPRVSPDGRHVAVGLTDGQEADVWIYDVSGTSPIRRLTFGGRNRFPIWSADGKRIAFQSDREGDHAIFWQRADTPGMAERLTTPETGVSHIAESWSPLGDKFLFSSVTKTATSLWVFSLPDRKATVFGKVDSSTPLNSQFSPDGRWVAYTLRSSGGADATVFVEPFPPTGAKFQITKDSSHHAVWSRDGGELSYRVGATQQMVASVATKPTFTAGNPTPLPGEYASIGFGGPANYDIMPDGKRFLIAAPAIRTESGTILNEIHIVINWTEELQRRAPVDR